MTLDCPACEQGTLEEFLGRGSIPVFCNVLHEDIETARAAPSGRLVLARCPRCGMVCNSAFDEAKVQYSASYENAQHFSPLFRKHLDETADSVSRRCLPAGGHAVEIGCGDGSFLRRLNRRGIDGTGFDPALPDGLETQEGEVRLIRGRLDSSRLRRPPDLLIARHVLEHIAAPTRFLRDLRQGVPEGTRAFFEVPDMLFTLEDLGIWDLLYEHCCYFTIPSLRATFETAGWSELRVRRAFANQYLQIEATARERTSREECSASAKLMSRLPSLTAGFERSFQEKVAHWNDRLEEWLAKDERVAVWGIGTKGVMFLNTIKGSMRIPAAIDLSPRKTGRYVPGTAHQVQLPLALLKAPVDHVLVMNPAYIDEVKDELQGLGLSCQVHGV